MNQEKVHIDDRFGKEFEGDYFFKEMCWAKRNRIIQKYTKYHPVTGQVVSSDFLGIQAESVIASMHSQPETKPLTLEKMLSEDNGIPIALGEVLSNVTNKLNNVENADIRFLLERLEEKSRTQLLQSLGFVKNSAGTLDSSGVSQQKPSSSS